MSSHIRYEIEVEIPAGGVTPEMEADSPKEAFERLLDGTEFSFQPDDVDRWGGTKNKKTYLIFTAYGEESDHSRLNEERHAEVVTAVHKKIPTAIVRTKWLNMDYVEWDDTFDTADEEDDDEDSGEEVRG